MTGTSALTRWTTTVLGVAVAAAGTATVGVAIAGSAAADGPDRTAFVSVDLDGAVELDGWAYFLADDGEHGTEVWRTDGTPGGTALYADTTPGGADSDTPIAQLYATAQGLLGTDLGSNTLYRVPAGTGTTVEVQGLDYLGGYAGTVEGDVALLWTHGPSAGIYTLAPGSDTAVPLEAALGARGTLGIASTGSLTC
ncbi:MAG: hypothetical protein CMH83_01495 [Nocardioides sp.]|nr:hypothetical protein [Nocardioides sp.]